MKKYSFIKVFLALVLLTTNACAMKNLKSTYDEKTQTTKYEKALKPPISIPFDITKQGNKIELELKIKESNSYSFRLEFYYDDPRRSKYWIVELVKHYLPQKKYSDEEWNEVMKDYNRVYRLIGTEELVVDSKPEEAYKSHWVKYPGIPTPIHLTIIKLEDDGSSKVVFDEVRDKWEGQNFVGCGPLSCNKELERTGLEKANYKISVQVIKDSPELANTKIHFAIGRGRIKY